MTAANLWAGVADGAELLKRVASLPGFGKQKSQIFVALLGKQYGVEPAGLAGGGRRLRRGRLVQVGGGHRRRRVAGQGPGVQEEMKAAAKK